MYRKNPFFIYLFTGGLNTLISLLVYSLMLKLGVNYLLSSSVTYVFGIIEGYIFSSVFVFKHKIRLSGLIKYSGVYGISFILNFILIYLTVSFLGMNKIIAQVIVTAILTILNYTLIKVLVFRLSKPLEKVSI